jgi:hypothetical protein
MMSIAYASTVTAHATAKAHQSGSTRSVTAAKAAAPIPTISPSRRALGSRAAPTSRASGM